MFSLVSQTSVLLSASFQARLQADELFTGWAEGLFFWSCGDADATLSAAYTHPDFSVKGQEGFYCGGGAGSPTGSSGQHSAQFDRLKFEEMFLKRCEEPFGMR